MHEDLDLSNEGKTTEIEFLSRSNSNENPDSYDNSFSRLSSAWLVYSGAEHQRNAKSLIQIRLRNFWLVDFYLGAKR